MGKRSFLSNGKFIDSHTSKVIIISGGYANSLSRTGIGVVIIFRFPQTFNGFPDVRRLMSRRMPLYVKTSPAENAAVIVESLRSRWLIKRAKTLCQYNYLFSRRDGNLRYNPAWLISRYCRIVCCSLGNGTDLDSKRRIAVGQTVTVQS